ncbi:MAG TPA: glycosyltransferase [Solirubrobacterales bacterium]|nr:glycosyltransferase [Solirubrobacterales bacterium]
MGGPAHQVTLLSGRRFPSRYESLLAHGSVPAGEGSLAYLARQEGAREIFVSELVQPISPVQDVRALRRLAGIIRSFRPDVIHTHTAKAGFIGRQAASLAGISRPVLVHTFHGHVLEGYFGRIKSGLYRRLERRLASGTDALIGVSTATVDDLVRLGVAPREKFRVVPLGLDLERFDSIEAAARPRARARLGYREGDVVCTFVGRLAPVKRVGLLIAALGRARACDERLQLLVVGDGAERASLERQARAAGLAQAVRFVGYRDDLETIWAGSDLAVLSSDNEGTPVALIEAAAAGLPAVATDVGGVAEAVSPESSLLVPPGDERGLANAMVELGGDPERRAAMGAIARARAIERFSVDRLIADISGLYQGLLDECAPADA